MKLLTILNFTSPFIFSREYSGSVILREVIYSKNQKSLFDIRKSLWINFASLVDPKGGPYNQKPKARLFGPFVFLLSSPYENKFSTELKAKNRTPLEFGFCLWAILDYSAYGLMSSMHGVHLGSNQLVLIL